MGIYAVLDSLVQNNAQVAQHINAKYQISSTALRAEYVANCGNASFYALFAQEYAMAEAYARKTLAMDKTQVWVNTNLANALLFQGKIGEAEQIYQNLKGKTYEQDPSQNYNQILLQDFKELEAASAIPKKSKKDVERIKKLLQP